MCGLGMVPLSFQTLVSCLWVARAEVTWLCRVRPLYKVDMKVKRRCGMQREGLQFLQAK